MSPFAGPFFAAALLLAAAGLAKVLRPASAARALRQAGLPAAGGAGRALGLAELAIAVIALAVGGRGAAALVGACYLGFAWFVVRLRRAAGAAADCGCFGAESSPASGVHVAVNLGLAAVAACAVGWPTAGIGHAVARTPLAGVPFLGLTLLAAWLVYITLTVVPDLQAAVRDVRAGGAGR